ncbi:hypothetical protein BGZ57DRAFT_860475 [Hyaloscypha finlandica]|nr:hypothetical protein BGZ57DRAFT_860475 [Hyaloscypha finlandica]
MAFRSISTRFTLPRLENPETRKSKHLSLQMQKGAKKPRKQSRCISNNRNLKHIVAQSPVTHGPGTPSMYLPKAATSSRGSFFKRRPPRPLQRRQPITEDSRIKALATSLPESSKRAARPNPPRRRARNKLYPRTLQVDVHIQYGIVSTKLWGSKRLRKISHAREAILQAHALRSSSPRGKLRIEMRGSRDGKTYCTSRCVKWRPVTAASREPVDGF